MSRCEGRSASCGGATVSARVGRVGSVAVARGRVDGVAVSCCTAGERRASERDQLEGAVLCIFLHRVRTGSFPQRTDVLGSDGRRLQHRRWPLRGRSEETIARSGEADERFGERRHVCCPLLRKTSSLVVASELRAGDKALRHATLDSKSAGPGSTSSSCRAATPADACDASEPQERDGMRISLAYTHTSWQKKRPPLARLQRCERSDVACYKK